VADIGLTGGSPNLLYINGKPDHKVSDEQLLDELENSIREFLKKRADEETPVKDARVAINVAVVKAATGQS